MKVCIQIAAVVGGAATLFFLGALAALPQDRQTTRQTTEIKAAESVGVSYARANMRLAQIDLEIVLSGNQAVSNLHSAQTIQRLRNNVAHSQDLLDYEIDQSKRSLQALRVRDLEREVKLAESGLASAISADRQMPGSVSDTEIERLRVTLEIARLALKMAREPDVRLSAEDQLRWQLEQLRSELTRLYVQLEEAVSHH